MVKLNLLQSLNHLSEIMQAVDIKFSFLLQTKDGFEQITTPMKCREYFNEFLMKNHHPKEFEFKPTHGFMYNWDKHPWDTKTTLMSMKFPDQVSMETFIKNIPFLHKVEEFNKIPVTKVELTDQQNTIVIIGDAFWNSKCILMNIYSWILKLCSIGANDLSQKQIHQSWKDAKEVEYLQGIGNTSFNNLLGNLQEIYQIPTKYVDGSDEIHKDPYVIHGYSGIVYIQRQVVAGLIGRFNEKFMETFKKILLVKETPFQFLKAA